MGVERDLEPARFDIGKAIVEVGAADIDPGGEFAGRKARISGGGCKEEDVLAARDDAVADDLGKQFGEPGAAGEDETTRAQRLAARTRDRTERGGVRPRRIHTERPETAPRAPDLPPPPPPPPAR